MTPAQEHVATQTWVALCRWPGRKPFTVGTFTTRSGAPNHEAEAAALAEWRDCMGAMLPEGTPLPEVLRLIPGALIFVPRDGYE